MFDDLTKRAAQLGGRRADAQRARLASELREELGGRATVEEASEGVLLSGRGLSRRFALDPKLRWLGARLK